MSISIFDDRDPTIVFSTNPAWGQGGTSSDFNGTSTWATNPGASFTFQFTGVGVCVFGPIQSGPSGSQSAYSVDGGNAQLLTAVPPVGVNYIYRQLLFNRSGLSGDVLHTLSVTTLMVTNATYFVDYIEVEAAPSVTTTLDSGNSITTSTTKWTDIPWINTSAIVSSTSEGFNLNTASPNSVDSTHPTSTTPILEAALGGIIFLLLTTASVLFLRWRRNRSMYLASIAARPVMANTPPSMNDDTDNRVLIS